MPAPIRLGDPTSHGGTVNSAAAHANFMGKPLARVGDSCTCPLPGHHDCKIIEGDPAWMLDGKPVALEGHQTSCGATLMSTLDKVDRG